jgi:hypothetical protein
MTDVIGFEEQSTHCSCNSVGRWYSLVAALVGIEDDAEWKIGTDLLLGCNGRCGDGQGQRWTFSAICFLLLLDYVQIVIRSLLGKKRMANFNIF